MNKEELIQFLRENVTLKVETTSENWYTHDTLKVQLLVDGEVVLESNEAFIF